MQTSQVTNQQILTKAIQKAIDGGWEYPFGANTYEIVKYVEARPEAIAFGFREEWQDADTPGHLEGHWAIPELIFNHDFAKALWGEEGKGTMQGGNGKIGWEYYLSHMVVAPDLIKYLGDNI